ncbi:response regulator transcription factor [Romboutsia sedimentorum]|uniref:Stage 0 sporulation protein A homolog n=1 Tax=Romboutsia sedimentorum TaxID=1368474 RepID=A0ABT7ECT7_9FIRM|nr:response regulator transcription factor [Romboutsia sedimentorum]MDK2563751.1 response regulator transcription factor [Romboutsia sedimentorum]MDK2586116.1 response regulator transcription factor [Romboutsia sedimentorum]
MGYKILIAEDDEDIIKLIKLYLENEKYEVFCATNGIDALNIVENNDIDLLVLDIMMPKLNGYEVTKKIRENSNMPILILSAKNLHSDKILGLDLGADDYIAKPFNPLEVIARIKSLLRRCYNLNIKIDKNKSAEKGNILEIGQLVLNTQNFTVTKDKEEIILTPSEYKILVTLMKSPGRVYTKVQIGEIIKGDYFISDDNTIMVHISKLREKIEDNPKNPIYIKTIRGVGYKFEKFKKN